MYKICKMCKIYKIYKIYKTCKIHRLCAFAASYYKMSRLYAVCRKMRKPHKTIYNCRDRTVCRKLPQTATTSPKKNFLMLLYSCRFLTRFLGYTTIT